VKKVKRPSRPSSLGPLNPLKKIKSGVFSRGLALAKVTVSVGAQAASHAVGSLFAKEADKDDRIRALLTGQVEVLARELGQLKGSLMKVGQMLSVYGEHFFPPEVNQVLKSLQSQSPPLEWAVIEKLLRRQLHPFGDARIAELEIDPEPLASASLGQVHRARRIKDNRELVLKIQYPGVDRAIDSDLSSLRSLLSIARLLQAGPRTDELFREVKQMLHQEVDYGKELEATRFFRDALAGDPRYIVAEVFPEYSTSRLLALSYEAGVPVDSPEVLGLSQERRDALAVAALDLYFRELFEFRLVQTDPHFGNYRVRLGGAGKGDRLVLFDFGAVRKVPESFLKSYRVMIRGAFDNDPAAVIRGAEGIGFLQQDDPPELRQQFVDLCLLIMEPFQESFMTTGYDWGGSDLPRRVARQGSKMIFSFRLRVPPREVVFLDRKMGGIFVFLSVLKVRIPTRDLLKKYL
jgi:predicted unusual protein kinase regulating ubiquinone biosynthesis (AarF/ABC1/UbiB family)